MILYILYMRSFTANNAKCRKVSICHSKNARNSLSTAAVNSKAGITMILVSFPRYNDPGCLLTHWGQTKWLSFYLDNSFSRINIFEFSFKSYVPIFNQTIAWCGTVDKPFSGPSSSMTHICVTWPQRILLINYAIFRQHGKLLPTLQ